MTKGSVNKSGIFCRLLIAALLFLCLSGLGAKASASDFSSIKFFVTPNPLSVKIIMIEPLGKDHHKSRHRRYRLVAAVTNNGASPISKLRVKIILPPGLKVNKNEQKLAFLPGNADRKITWKLTASASGDYLVRIKAKGMIMDSGQTINATDFQNISLTRGDKDNHEERVREIRWLRFSRHFNIFHLLSFWRS